MVISPR